jgi:hypothetical protein
MGEKSRSGSGMNIPDHIYETLETFFCVNSNSPTTIIADPEMEFLNAIFSNVAVPG